MNCEQYYLAVSDLAKLRIAIDILRDLNADCRNEVIQLQSLAAALDKQITEAPTTAVDAMNRLTADERCMRDE